MSIKDIPIHEPDQRPTLRSLLLGIVVWFVYFNATNSLNSVACKWQWFPTIAGFTNLTLVEMVITAVAAILMLILIYVPWRDWRRFQRARPTENPNLLQDTEKDRRPMLAFVAMLLNVLFLLIIIASFVPMVVFNPCGQG